jgi:hypothetical protein
MEKDPYSWAQIVWDRGLVVAVYDHFTRQKLALAFTTVDHLYYRNQIMAVWEWKQVKTMDCVASLTTFFFSFVSGYMAPEYAMRGY